MKNYFTTINKALLCIFIVILCSFSTVYAQKDWEEIEAGGEFSLAIKSDGTLWAWGANFNGNLGTGDTSRHYSPVQVGTDSDWATIAAGGFHGLAIKENGTLWGWGLNQVGSTGTGSTDMLVLEPTQVGTEDNWTAISAGYAHSLAIKDNGSLWGWGYNNFGQINNSGMNVSTPVLIDDSAEWEQVSTGGFHSAAIADDGSLWTWGFNGDGELGDGTTVARTEPGRIDTAHTYIDVSLGFQASYAIRSDSSLWSWGFNGNNELGIDTTLIMSSLPLNIGTASDWSHVEAGSTYGMAMKGDGSLYAWGSNFSGQLGLGDKMNKSKPIKVGSNKWNQIALAEGVISQQRIFGSHSLGLKEDNTVICATGANYIGQLGDSTMMGRTTLGCNTGEITTVSSLDLNNKYKLKIYPNPVGSQLNVDFNTPPSTEIQLSIFNSLGEKVFHKESLDIVNSITLPALPDGLYILKLRENEHEMTEKILISH